MSERNRFMNRVINSKSFQVFLSALRVLLGVIFLYAGITKIADPAGFALAVYNYHLLPGWLVNITAIMLPWIEVVAGMSLILGLWTSGGALILPALLIIFTIALAFNLSRGLDIACGCFSTSSSGEHITWWYLLRDSSMAVTSLLIFLLDQGRFTLGAYLPVRRREID